MTKLSLLGVPHDGNSSFMRGPAEAPPLIRAELFSDCYGGSSETGVDLLADGVILDHGDVAFDDGGDPWTAIELAVAAALEPGHPLITLGGDHAVTWPILMSVHRRHGPVSILHIDAHPDLYDAYQDNPRSHASPFARIMEQGLASRLVQVGLRAIHPDHRAQFERFGVEAIEARHCSPLPKLRFDGPVYISLDLDGLDPSCAPGVSHREPGGLTTRQVIELIQSIDAPIVGADIVEYNPRCDLGGMTATVAAKLVKEIGGMMVNARPASAGS
ncbi:agmatinase [Caulobacter ginsengisoli]|uniref:Agmatinase n=1 Tax=Caulobacter ginsengisoli TaxID=400775 RepID=A0ABU0IKQ2_9CAUL|nr:agmatinase family protein [Caulobacter ginsengisoli]MDQ0462591.1 agmatinase [Caulobacter ginsengisoli]